MGGNTTIAELIANGIVTLAAAFFGAWAAFKLESSDRKKQTEDDHVAAGNRALFKLTQIWSKLRQYQKEIIDDYRERRDAWLNLPVGTSIQDSSLVFGMDELEFIMNTKPAVFQQIFLESDRFRMVAKLIDERSELVLSEVHPRMSHAGIPVGGSESEDVMEGLISIGIVHQLKIITAGIIRNVDVDEKSSFEAYTALRAALKEVYPNRKFLEFQKIM